MRALSWKEPFGSLMLYGKIETRTWSTNYRGQVLLCCSQKGYSDVELLKGAGEKQFHRIKKLLSGKELHHGHAIAVGNLVDCRPMTPEDADACFVAYHPELRCHVYEDVRPIKPFPFKGAQRWKRVDGVLLQMSFGEKPSILEIKHPIFYKAHKTIFEYLRNSLGKNT